MNVFAKRTPPRDGEEMPRDLDVPVFLTGQQLVTKGLPPMEAEIARLPHPVRSDPLASNVDPVLLKSITEPVEAYIRSIVEPLKLASEAAQATYEAALAWGDGERTRALARAQDVNAEREEMRTNRDKFLALPRAKMIELEEPNPDANQ